MGGDAQVRLQLLTTTSSTSCAESMAMAGQSARMGKHMMLRVGKTDRGIM